MTHLSQAQRVAGAPVRYVIRREAAIREELLSSGGWSENDLLEYPWPQVVHTYAIDHAGEARQVKHHIRHSPTGFESSYEGSRTAELGRCLLCDYFALDPDQEALPVCYQQFKRTFIASIACETRETTIDVMTIEACIREQSEVPR